MSLLNHADNSHVVNTTRVSNVPTDPDNVYLDVIMTNVLGNLTPAVPINYTENRTNAIVSNTGDYSVSVVRFSLESQTLPVFIPLIQPNQGNRDLTAYSITIKITPVGSPAGTIFTQLSPSLVSLNSSLSVVFMLVSPFCFECLNCDPSANDGVWS